MIVNMFFGLRFYLETIKGTQDHIIISFLLFQEFKTFILEAKFCPPAPPAKVRTVLTFFPRFDTPFLKNWIRPCIQSIQCVKAQSTQLGRTKSTRTKSVQYDLKLYQQFTALILIHGLTTSAQLLHRLPWVKCCH